MDQIAFDGHWSNVEIAVVSLVVFLLVACYFAMSEDTYK